MVKALPVNKPKSLDSVPMVSLNSLIACNGPEQAEKVYLETCKRREQPVYPWAIDYIRLYNRYRRKSKNPCWNYIDVKAAERALSEA